MEEQNVVTTINLYFGFSECILSYKEFHRLYCNSRSQRLQHYWPHSRAQFKAHQVCFNLVPHDLGLSLLLPQIFYQRCLELFKSAKYILCVIFCGQLLTRPVWQKYSTR